MMGGIGCFVSSAITMLVRALNHTSSERPDTTPKVFFPRSMTFEAGYKAHALSQQSKPHAATELPDYERHDTPLPSPKSMASGERTPQPEMHSFRFSDAQPDTHHHADDETLPQHYDLHSPAFALRPPSGSRSDDTVWDGARKPAASTSQLGRHPDTFKAPMFINGTPIYVEEVPPSAPHSLVHPYVSPAKYLRPSRSYACTGNELHVAHRPAGGRRLMICTSNQISRRLPRVGVCAAQIIGVAVCATYTILRLAPRPQYPSPVTYNYPHTHTSVSPAVVCLLLYFLATGIYSYSLSKYRRLCCTISI